MSDIITARMADAFNPANIPHRFKLRPNGVAGYIDGADGHWATDQFADFPRVWRICTTGNVLMAPHARVLDVEQFDATAEAVEPYRARRAEAGDETIVYCSRNTIRPVVDACPNWQLLEWWIATLDYQAWTPSSLVTYVKSVYGVSLDPEKIRAIQIYPMGSYDASACFGRPRWAAGKPKAFDSHAIGATPALGAARELLAAR